MQEERAKQIVVDAYALILGRKPDEQDLDVHVASLMNGTQDGFDLAKSLLESQEKAVRTKLQENRVNPDLAQELLTQIYLSLFGREPDNGAIQAVRQYVQWNHVSISQLYTSIMNDIMIENESEFADRVERTVTSERAEQIVVEAYALILGRAPDAGGLKNHAEALLSGSLDGYSFARSLMLSDEKKQLDAERVVEMIPDGVTQPHQSGASDEIVILIQDLIAVRLQERGCRWAVPPLSSSGQPVSANVVVGLIRTLTMLGNPGRPSADAR